MRITGGMPFGDHCRMGGRGKSTVRTLCSWAGFIYAHRSLLCTNRYLDTGHQDKEVVNYGPQINSCLHTIVEECRFETEIETPASVG